MCYRVESDREFPIADRVISIENGIVTSQKVNKIRPLWRVRAVRGTE